MPTPEINAEVSGAAANSYLTIEEADERMSEFTNSDKWDELKDADDRARLLLRATRLVDRYKLWPPRMVPTQRLAFPTSKELLAEIPESVKVAVLEIVDYILDGTLESLKKLQAEGVSSMSVLGQSMTLTDFATSPMDRSQIPAPARQELDLLYATYNAPVLGQHEYDGSDDPEGTSLFG
jgi:hypothetical protein